VAINPLPMSVASLPGERGSNEIASRTEPVALEDE
jgi:hypothetical protein